jgi:hypothetical protein
MAGADFLTIRFTVLFAVPPFGVRAQHETGDIAVGTAPGGPAAVADYAGRFSHPLTRRADAATPTTLVKERVAQLVEHLTFNQEVMGSNPIALTNETWGLIPSALSFDLRQ